MNNHLDKLFGGNPVQRIDAIINEMFQDCIKEAGGQEGVEMLIRQQKACKIEDIMRGFKIAQLYDTKIAKAIRPENLTNTFDALYDMDLDVLDAYMMALDLKNTKYMRDQVEKNNRADWNKPDTDYWR